MNNDKLIAIWTVLINNPIVPFKHVAKRCKATEAEVDVAARLMGKHANKKRDFS